MINSELQLIYNKIKASSYEEVFGTLEGTADEQLAKGKEVYRMLVKQTHPDRFLNEDDKKFAEDVFKELTKLWDTAQDLIKKGRYGKNDVVIITPTKAEYRTGTKVATGSIADVYLADIAGSDKQVLIKICRQPINNDLMNNEMKNLAKVWKEKTDFVNLIAEPVDSFILARADNTNCNCNVFAYTKGLVSLESVIKAYPNGIDQKDMAWMFKRSLSALWWAHTCGIIHGAPIPPHILLNLENHGIVLIDWTQSANLGKQHIKIIDPAYQEYYPSGVLKKEKANPSMDIYILAKTMIKLLGGDPTTKSIPDNVSREIRAILKSCLLENGWDDAKFIHQEFDATIKELFGPAKWREFSIPKV